MTYGPHRLTLPSDAELSGPMVRRIVREIEVMLRRTVSLEEWDAIK